MYSEVLMTTTRKAHVAIFVRDVTRSVEFYRKMFGSTPSKVRTGYAKFDIADPPLNFSLNELPDRASVGARDGASLGEGGSQTYLALSHLGIQVGSTEEVLAVRERWIAQGLIPRDEMGTDCCYAVQDKSWVRDPDGNEWEVFVVLQDNLPEKPAQEAACCGPNCCAPVVIAPGKSQ
jgi:catechol 2,3-dioxygenase-like lactoylglutathione lyase family enzyme